MCCAVHVKNCMNLNLIFGIFFSYEIFFPLSLTFFQFQYKIYILKPFAITIEKHAPTKIIVHKILKCNKRRRAPTRKPEQNENDVQKKKTTCCGSKIKRNCKSRLKLYAWSQSFSIVVFLQCCSFLTVFCCCCCLFCFLNKNNVIIRFWLQFFFVFSFFSAIIVRFTKFIILKYIFVVVFS